MTAFRYITGILLVVIMLSCTSNNNKKRLILTDTNTGRVYLIKHHIGDTYMIYELYSIKEMNDTTWVFKQ
jgi:hypothetical protein